MALPLPGWWGRRKFELAISSATGVSGAWHAWPPTHNMHDHASPCPSIGDLLLSLASMHGGTLSRMMSVHTSPPIQHTHPHHGVSFLLSCLDVWGTAPVLPHLHG